MNLARCFISYCSDDVEQEAMLELLHSLRIVSNGGIEFYYDKENHPGICIRTFMDNIMICDSIVVVCSPCYKRKLAIDGNNVHYEYNKIYKRYSELSSIMKNSKTEEISKKYFNIIPIIISNAEFNKIEKNDAYPEWFDKDLSLTYGRYTFVSDKTKKEFPTRNDMRGKIKSSRDKLLIDIKSKLTLYRETNNAIVNAIVAKTIAAKTQRPITAEDRNTRTAKLIENH
jgi:hypothetical protein